MLGHLLSGAQRSLQSMDSMILGKIRGEVWHFSDQLRREKVSRIKFPGPKCDRSPLDVCLFPGAARARPGTCLSLRALVPFFGGGVPLF